MAPPDQPQRTQEQSIKARKHQLFESDERSGEHGPRQSFADLLRATPADPLAPGLRAALWVVGTLVILLLLAAFLKVGTRKSQPRTPPAASSPHPLETRSWLADRRAGLERAADDLPPPCPGVGSLGPA